MTSQARAYDPVKRTLDAALALAGLAVLSPVLLVVAAAVALESRGGILYGGIRVGQNGTPFRMLKFRTMHAGQAGPTSTSADDTRITRVGAWIRRFKIDELPQLVNVLRGDMSLVGPRPQVQWAVDLYSPEERRVLEVRPGITDWASIKFHNEGEILRGQGDPDEAYMRLIHPEKTRLALEYVERRSLRVDLSILLHTLTAAIKP